MSRAKSQSPEIRELIVTSHRFHARGWAPATSGNYSAVLDWCPFRMAITASGTDKARLTERDIAIVNSEGEALGSSYLPSAETRIHLAIVTKSDQGAPALAVVHTHSIWSAIWPKREVARFHGLEILKALSGVESHQHTEVLPILENNQDYDELAELVGRVRRNHPKGHGLLVAGHGLYAWGTTVAEARRHAEALEFCLEVTGRRMQHGIR